MQQGDKDVVEFSGASASDDVAAAPNVPNTTTAANRAGGRAMLQTGAPPYPGAEAFSRPTAHQAAQPVPVVVDKTLRGFVRSRGIAQCV